MQLMSIEDLSAYLGDSKRTIYKYIASGDCPPYVRISAKNDVVPVVVGGWMATPFFIVYATCAFASIVSSSASSFSLASSIHNC